MAEINNMCICKDCRKRDGIFESTNRIYNLILNFQNNRKVHPLICEKCSSSLFPSLYENKIILVCPECGWKQEKIPEFVFDFEKISR